MAHGIAGNVVAETRDLGTQMTIRKTKVSDAPAIRELVLSLTHFYLEHDTDPLPQWFLSTLDTAEFEKRLTSTQFTSFVCIQDDTIIGYIALKNPGHLYHLFVNEAHQGQGISRQLWNHLITHAKSGTYTVRSSLHAVPVYQRFGFEISESVATKDGLSFQSMKYS